MQIFSTKKNPIIQHVTRNKTTKCKFHNTSPLYGRFSHKLRINRYRLEPHRGEHAYYRKDAIVEPAADP